MAVKFTNNATTTLSAGITDTATSISVTSISSFPSLAAGDHMYLTIVSVSNIEVVKVTSVSVNTFTCVRAQDNTTAASALSGDTIELRLTAAMLNDLTGDGDHASKGFSTAMSIAL